MAKYSIWVLEYAFAAEYPVGGVVYGAHNKGTLKLPYGYVLIKGNGRTILVDVGYNYQEYGRAMADRFGVTNWHSPEVVLGEVGVKPADVDTVLVTHAHFDHFGNISAFRNATVYVQQREMSQWLWAMSLPKQFSWLVGALDPADVIRGAELAQDGRLVLVDGDRENILPGIDLFAAFETHTFGSQFVRVRSDDTGSWVLAGDLVYVRENVVGLDGGGTYVPVGLATGSQTNLLLTTERMISLVDREPSRIIAVHERRLPDMFPSRVTDKGLAVVEVTLSSEERSQVSHTMA